MKVSHRWFFALLLLGVLLGAGVTSVQNDSLTRETVLRGALHGGFIAFPFALLSMAEISTRTFYRRMPPLLRVTFLTVIVVPLVMLGRATAFRITGERAFQFIGSDPNFGSTVVIAFIVVLLANFMKQFMNLLGPRTFLHLLTGRYYRSRRETRLICYIDLAGSTAIAERLGDERYLEFLNRFFRLLTQPLRGTGGGIHKYVGDEAIITWRERRGNAANGLAFIRMFQEQLTAHRADFERDFGLSPQWRGSLHYGEIVMGEMGDLRKEIAFLGDTLNTGARLMDVARTEGSRLIVSGTVPGCGQEPELRPLGERRLRGKEGALELYAWK